ncbi:MAG: ATP-binding cassette domain-containing protein [Planctomycetota bacterium]|nr:ABC transporter ATP-binding protein [Planctomycetota bacterium]MEE2713304.1 ATP-binding cassette domain-containing protein [Planctomycetota bacterium]
MRPGGIQVEALAKVFEDRKRGLIRAVDGVSFSCAPGRIFGLLGPNGAGKTTALRILSTVLRPSGGTVTVNGFDSVRDAEQVRASIGFLSGATALYERSTAREVIGFFGELFGIDRSRVADRVDELSEMLKMEAFLDQACGKLSAGQRQKVSIARTIVHDPPVIILDEPTANLDVLVAREVVLFVASERDRGKTVLLSTHIMSEVDRLCDDVAIIHEGRLLLAGTKDEVVQRGGGSSVEDIFFQLVPVDEDVAGGSS